MIKGSKGLAKTKLALCVTGAILALSHSTAQAASFEVAGFDVKFDSTFSLGAGWRVEGRDFGQIGKSNNPSLNWTGYDAAINPLYAGSDLWPVEGSYSTNGDAGNLNFDPGETYSKLFKGLHELEVSNGDYGAFVRFMYFYDFELMEGDRAHKNYLSGNSVDPCRDKKSRELVCRDIRLLDAFAFANFDLNDGQNPLQIRVGDQVLSWGESTLISHGIAINPVDVAALKAPGAELKEAFIPVGMVWASLGINENLAAEFFYQYDWHETYLPAPGSYFSTNDFAGEGGYLNNIQLGFTSNPDIDLDHLTAKLNSLYATWQQVALAQGIDPTSAAGQQLLANMYLAYPTKVALKGDVHKPKDSGQFGLKLSVFAPELNDSEFGFYFVNYHSNRPLISGVVSNFTAQGIGSDLAFIKANQITADNVTQLQAFTKGVLEYPEDIKLYGFSFNTSVGETALSGELSYRQDEPLQIDDVELLYAGMPEQLAIAGLRPELAGISQLPSVAPGAEAQGYKLFDTVQAQMTATHLFGPALGLDNLAMVAEVGVVQVQDMPAYNELRLQGPGTARSGVITTKDGRDVSGVHVALSNGPEETPFPTATSWGYRLVVNGEINNVFGGFNVVNRLVFSHDVNGISPDPMYLFTEDKKSIGFTTRFDYQSTWSAEFSYNTFWGGVGKSNDFADRDYVSFNIKYSI